MQNINLKIKIFDLESLKNFALSLVVTSEVCLHFKYNGSHDNKPPFYGSVLFIADEGKELLVEAEYIILKSPEIDKLTTTASNLISALNIGPVKQPKICSGISPEDKLIYDNYNLDNVCGNCHPLIMFVVVKTVDEFSNENSIRADCNASANFYSYRALLGNETDIEESIIKRYSK
jgi:hypothetical protein